ncbi:MAG TPA: hypothetical protein VMZ71_00840 [Gemmataceae bacterium]|nr:hypothetical protein [Gemmataceae bacterium]
MTTTTTDSGVRIEDVQGVRSRVSWSAILGGAVIALATYLVLTFFFAALGFSLSEAGVRENAVSIGALVAAVLTIALALYFGGWVTTQLSVGETRCEAMIYGLLTWAVVMAFSIGMIGMGMRAGYFAVVSGTLVAQNSGYTGANWEAGARAMGASDQSIANMKASMDPNRVQAAANDPATREQLRQGAVVAAWSAFAGTLLSIAACVFGAVAGRGATFRLFPVATVRPASGGIIMP